MIFGVENFIPVLLEMESRKEYITPNLLKKETKASEKEIDELRFSKKLNELGEFRGKGFGSYIWERFVFHEEKVNELLNKQVNNEMEEKEFMYDIALSFAGEDREYVESIASVLKSKGVRVFYDEFEQANLWGKDLAVHFDYIYRQNSRFFIPFISKHYKNKVWTKHEFQTALSKALELDREYILPVKLDDTEIDGLRSTIGFIDLRSISNDKFIEIIREKIKISNANKDNESEPTMESSMIKLLDEDKNIYEVKSLSPKENIIKYKFTDGSSMSFSLKEIRRRYVKKEDFINEHENVKNDIINRGSATKEAMSDILEFVWKKSYR